MGYNVGRCKCCAYCEEHQLTSNSSQRGSVFLYPGTLPSTETRQMVAISDTFCYAD